MSREVEWILDTSVLLNFLANEKHVIDRLLSLNKRRIFLTPITIAEAYYGLMVRRIGDPDGLSKLLGDFGVIPLNTSVALQFAQRKHDAGIRGCQYDRDLWMVAFCDVVGATLLTTDTKLKHRLRHLDPPIEVIPLEA